MDSQNSATLRLLLNSSRPAAPQTDAKASSGTVIFTNRGPELIVDRINAPFMDYVEGAIEVTGNSMEPTFRNGCRIAISRIRDKGMDY
jgi:phage repressor protein C with HTH and peptisase S24 domain